MPYHSIPFHLLGCFPILSGSVKLLVLSSPPSSFSWYRILWYIQSPTIIFLLSAITHTNEDSQPCHLLTLLYSICYLLLSYYYYIW
ncbi:hypothetical protein DL95DRAFT_388444 [Leptodontidium sp. 2 PMI_412]|nr:hypothetical protein DL95DRAFT_388444 [Leptodontidium sp. 2 PMI_412]